MEHIKQKQEQLKSNFEKVLAQKTIEKGSILSLKRQTRVLVKNDETFKPFLTKLTTQINGMKKGVLNYDRREKIQNLVFEYLK